MIFGRAIHDAAPERSRLSRGRAFTLVEVLLVLALLALFAAVFVPGVNSMLAQMNERGPDQLASEAVLAARTEALESGRSVELTYDADARQVIWGAGAVRSDALPPGVNLEFLPVETGGNILLGGELAEAQEPLKRVRFFPDGTCEPFRLRIKSGQAKPRVLLVDPWTCALSPATKA
jgi:prepilin-type N-terminal cleavage/methylation domain-containing protein